MRLFGAFLLFAVVAVAQEPSLHPRFQLLDAMGRNVLDSDLDGGAPVSPRRTCGTCHDTAYIAAHNYHVTAFGKQPGLTRAGADLDPAAWMRKYGARHTGGGDAPAEMNCFLCHLRDADNAARVTELRAGRFDWAATATLAGTGIVKRTDNGWTYDAKRFRDGHIDLAPRDPPDRNCGFCHGPVHAGPEPLSLRGKFDEPELATRGQVFSAQRLKDSALNLAGKEKLTFAWDIHAERLVRCAACHHAPNNPVFRQESDATRPEHLRFDARRPAFGEYLKQPDHNFARAGTIRQCADCHRTDETHEWLPYRERHMARVRCEACHIPRVYAPVRSVTDWTGDGLTGGGAPRVEYRGIDGAVDDPRSLVTGWEPALLPDDEGRLAPFNLMVEWSRADGGAVEGRVHAYRLNHNVVPGAYAIRDCAECHAPDSRIGRAMDLGTPPAGAGAPEGAPEFNAAAQGYYVLGHERTEWIDMLGIALTLLVCVGAVGHGVLRWIAGRGRA